MSKPLLDFVDEDTFNKALFDTLTELLFSVQLAIARSANEPKWNNSRGIPELNQVKQKHQSDITNLNTGIFIELKGVIEAWCINEEVNLSPEEIISLTLSAQYHWHESPKSRAFPTLRILSALFGLMRYDYQRKYKDGDLADFLAAASALPVAEAMFTDRKLAFLLRESRIALKHFTNCAVVNGFDEMARYIKNGENR